MAALRDYIKIKHGFAFKGDHISTIDNGVVLVTPGNFSIGGGFKEDKCKFYDGECPTDYILKSDDLIVTMTDLSKSIDTLGYSAIVPKSKRIYLHNQRIGLVQIIDEEKIDKHYLYWFMRTTYYQKNIAATSSGSTVHHTSPDRIMDVEIELPDVKIQRRVAKLMDNIEEIINTNKQINNNLEQQAQAIYQQMFIKNRNSNWKEGKLSDLVAVKYGKDHKKLDDGCYPVYGSGGIMRYVEKPLYTGESVLIPRKGTLNNVMYVNGAFWSVDTMFYTEMLRPNIAKFVYHFVKGKDLASLNAGSAVPSMTTNILNAIPLYVPDDETLSIFEETVTPMYAQIQENEKQSANLANIRDTLLPRLMSGELDVSDIDL